MIAAPIQKNSFEMPQMLAGLLAFGILLFGIAAVVQADNAYRSERVERAMVRSEILAFSVTAAVDFGDREAVNRATDAFRADPNTRIAAVYDRKGNLLGDYSRQGFQAPSRLPRNNGDPDTVIEIFVPIEKAQARIGTVYLQADAMPFIQRAARFATISIFVLAASLIVLILSLGQRSLRRANADLAQKNIELQTAIETRQAAEAQLRQAQKMEAVGQLTGGIAHDFNNMLAIVLGGIDMAERRIDDTAKARSALAHAREGASRAADLTKRLLAFARQQPLQPRVIEANRLVSNMSELLRRTLGEGVRIETVLAGGLWPTHADPGQLENAILNLCVNARDAMDGKGRLTIETHNAHLDEQYTSRHEDVTPGQYVVVAVSDTGMGMPPEVLARAFEPFFTTKGVGKGTGLGLAQVHGFVRQSGGHLAIYSEVGQGTTIKIYLPRHHGEVRSTIDNAKDAEPLPRGSISETILVVEDEERVRQMSVACLQELGYSVIGAGNATEALEIVALRPEIDLLFTDIVMPGMNGRELADAVHERAPHIGILYTTGYTKNAIIHNGVVDRGVTFIAKPFTMDELARKVRSTLDGSKSYKAD